MTSLVGYDLTYNMLDNNRNPTSGLLATFKQDFAGVGGDVQFIRTTADIRSYYEPMQDVIGVLRLQGGYIHGWGSDGLRMLDHFQMGPNLVRGFPPAGIGPRDLTNFPTFTGDALGGSALLGGERRIPDAVLFRSEGGRHQACGLCGRRIALEVCWTDQLGTATGETLRAFRQRYVRQYLRRCGLALGVAVRPAEV